MVSRRWLSLLAFVAPGVFSAVVGAAIEITVAVDDIQGEDWRLSSIALRLRSASAGFAGLVAEVDELVLPQGRGTLRSIQLECDDLRNEAQGWRCEAGRLHAAESPAGAQETPWQGSFTRDGRWLIDIAQLKVARGAVALKLSGEQNDWSADLRVHRLAVTPLSQLSEAIDLPTAWGIKGWASGVLEMHGDPSGPTGINAELVVDQLNFSSPDGRHAAENATVKLLAKTRMRGGAWFFDTNLTWPKGAMYAEPVFVDAGLGTIKVNAKGFWGSQSEVLQFDSWSIQLPQTVALSGTGRLRGDAKAIDDLTIVARSDQGARLYETLLQPFLIGSAADDLEVQGSVGLVVHFDAKGIEQAGLELSELVLADRQGRYSIGTTDGSVAWDRDKSVPVSRLSVQDASVYQIPTGSFSIEARFSGDGIRLEKPVVVPVSGGEIRLDNFELVGALMAGERPRWKADASVRGVSLEQLTTALDWPPFAGSLEGTLRDTRYADQLFSVGGGLQVDAFDGSILVQNLEIRDPLGSVPVLTADAEFRRLSLLALTQTFSFGRIEGRLDGQIDDIRLFAWQPDSFKMHLYTPQDDDLKHRISQRAVENLTEIGNGISAGLSTTFLRIFDEFRYDRIDLKVLLQGDVAELDGLARADGGYYLVKGAGLPRIDVIGRNRSVAWKDLVERLQRIQVEQARIQ